MSMDIFNMNSKKILTTLTALLCTSPIFASNTPRTFQAALDHYTPHTPYQSQIGISVSKTSDHSIVFEKNSDNLFAPASTQKIFIATAAIIYLKPDFTFDTTLTHDGVIKNHTLAGNLYVNFTGDPYLTSDDINELFKAIRVRGIEKITGDVIVNTSQFDDVLYPPGWLWGDLSYSFAAPLSAIIIDKNKFIAHFSPLHKKATISTPFPQDFLTIDNQITVTKHYDKSCPLTVYSDVTNHYTIGGCLASAWGKQRRSLAVRDPKKLARLKISQALKNNHITYPTIKFNNHTNNNNILLVEHNSQPLNIIMNDLLQESNNLTANALLKTIGALYSKKPGTWESGIHAMQTILHDNTEIDFHHMLLTDASGLSRYNLITPHQLTQLLDFIDSSPSIKKNLESALPTPGKGTMTYRLLSQLTKNRVKVKTGSMAGVSSLAGYIETKNNGTISFSILINGLIGPQKQYHTFEDHLCQWLVNAPRNLHG